MMFFVLPVTISWQWECKLHVSSLGSLYSMLPSGKFTGLIFVDTLERV